MNEIEKKVIEIVKENCSCEKVVLSDNLRNDLGMDSLDIMSLTMEIEIEFGIQVLEYEVESMKTVEDVLSYVVAEKKLLR